MEVQQVDKRREILLNEHVELCNIEEILLNDDIYFMKRALQEAEIAFDKGEVPGSNDIQPLM